MKFWVLSDNHDTLTGLRLAGIDGEIIGNSADIPKTLDRVNNDESIGILLVTAGLYNGCKERLDELRLRKARPLVVEIPDRHDSGNIGSNITEYIRDAIGIKI